MNTTPNPSPCRVLGDFVAEKKPPCQSPLRRAASLASLCRVPHGKFHGGLSPETSLLPPCTSSCFQNNNLLILEYDPA